MRALQARLFDARDEIEYGIVFHPWLASAIVFALGVFVGAMI